MDIGVGDGLPTSIQDIERLVVALYEPAAPEVVSQIQATLHRIQKLPQGWRIARDLLSRPDEKVKFFGILTIIVKVNTESSSLTSEAATELLSTLLGWLVEFSSGSSITLVSRKLSSALVAFFLHFPRSWPLCFWHVICCLHWGRNVPVDDMPEPLGILPELDPIKMQVALLFATDLLEEAGKVDMDSANQLGLYEQIQRNMANVLSLISYGLCLRASTRLQEDEVKQSSVRCLQACISLSCRVFPRSDAVLDHLRSLIPTVIDVLPTTEVVYNVSMDLLLESLSSNPSLFTEAHYSALFSLSESPMGVEYYRRLSRGDLDHDCVQFGLFVINLGNARLQTLISGQEEHGQNLLSRLCDLLTADGYPVADDKIFVPAIEFWCAFSEELSDCLLERDRDSATAQLSRGLLLLMRVITHACRKLVFPPQEIWGQWDSVEREGFSDARKDVADLLQSAYALAGPSLVMSFADLSLQTLSANELAELEAATFCLGALADCVTGNPNCDYILKPVFTSSLFTTLQHPQGYIPARTRQTCISLIEKYSDYFERNTSELPSALNLLFSVVGDPLLEGQAAKSVHRLCVSCRSFLNAESTTFLEQYRALLAQPVDCLTRERIIGAISSVVQAIPDDQRRLHDLGVLLDFVADDVQHSLRLMSKPDITGDENGATRCSKRCVRGLQPGELPLHVGLRALRCLANIGKGFQGPVDAVISTDGGDDIPPNQSEAVTLVQRQVMTMISRLQGVFSSSGEVIDVICSLLRTGFSEFEPGPFVFPPDIFCSYIIAHSLRTPRIGALVSTACSFVSSRQQDSEEAKAVLSKMTAWVVGLLAEQADAEVDPELSQNGIDFVRRVLHRAQVVLLGLQPSSLLGFFFSFTFRVLDGREPLPKASAADFWASFISTRAADTAIQEVRDTIMNELGPEVARLLVRNIGGNAARSELDKLAEPVKKLVVNHPAAGRWLEAALVHPSFPSQKVSDEEKRMFLKKVVSLRGARQTNRVVRDFWLASRGTNFAYVS